MEPRDFLLLGSGATPCAHTETPLPCLLLVTQGSPEVSSFLLSSVSLHSTSPSTEPTTTKTTDESTVERLDSLCVCVSDWRRPNFISVTWFLRFVSRLSRRTASVCRGGTGVIVGGGHPCGLVRGESTRSTPGVLSPVRFGRCLGAGVGPLFRSLSVSPLPSPYFGRRRPDCS